MKKLIILLTFTLSQLTMAAGLPCDTTDENLIKSAVAFFKILGDEDITEDESKWADLALQTMETNLEFAMLANDVGEAWAAAQKSGEDVTEEDLFGELIASFRSTCQE